MWMGDMEHDFLIKGAIEWHSIDILFAPHHGRGSGKVSSDVLEKMDPSITVKRCDNLELSLDKCYPEHI